MDPDLRRASRNLSAALILLSALVPTTALAAPAASRVTVESVGAAAIGTGTPSPRDVEAVRSLLAPHLSPADLGSLLASPATVSRVARLLSVLASPAGRDQRIDVEVVPVPGGGRTVYVSLRHRGSLERSGADRSYRQESDVTVGEVAITLQPPPRPAPVIAMPAPPPSRPDRMPGDGTPCPPADAACWQRHTLRQLSASPPTCEAYLVEQEGHQRRMAWDPDPNGQAARSATPDPGAPERYREAHVRDFAGPYPSGEIISGREAQFRRDIRIVNTPRCAPPTPARPTDGCFAEWAERSVEAVPTLACTREVVNHQHWRVGDGLVRAAEAPFSPIASLPIISNILAAKARRVADDTSWRGIFAVRWMERLADARERGDAAYVDRAVENLSGAPDERQILATNLRRWLASSVNAPWHETIRAFYEERFTALYPDAVDDTGLPALERFPTRLWWATNWLAAVGRRGLSPQAAAEVLRCAKDGARAVAVLKDLAPHLAGDPRFAPMVGRLVALL